MYVYVGKYIRLYVDYIHCFPKVLMIVQSKNDENDEKNILGKLGYDCKDVIR